MLRNPADQGDNSMARTTQPASGADRGIKITVKPFGPTSEELAALGARVLSTAALRDFVGHAKTRLLYVEALDDDDVGKTGKPRPPSRFRATFYDDKLHRTVFAEGGLGDTRKLTLTESALPPPPSEAEFAAAV